MATDGLTLSKNMKRDWFQLHLLHLEWCRKGKFMLSNDRNGALLRQQPRAMTQGLSLSCVKQCEGWGVLVCQS